MHPEGESEKKTVVETPSSSVNQAGVLEDISEIDSTKKVFSEIKTSKWKVVQQSNEKLFSGTAKGSAKLTNILNELNQFSIDELNGKSERIAKIDSMNCFQSSRRYFANILNQTKFHYFIIITVVIDLIVVFVDLILGLFFNLKNIFRNFESLQPNYPLHV